MKQLAKHSFVLNLPISRQGQKMKKVFLCVDAQMDKCIHTCIYLLLTLHQPIYKLQQCSPNAQKYICNIENFSQTSKILIFFKVCLLEKFDESWLTQVIFSPKILFTLCLIYFRYQVQFYFSWQIIFLRLRVTLIVFSISVPKFDFFWGSYCASCRILSSPTRDRTHAPCSGSVESYSTILILKEDTLDKKLS